jgi:V8-like Glu-specific endopeptidase
MDNTFFDELRDLVGDDELEKALARLLTFVQRSDRHVHNAALALKSSLRNLDRQRLDPSFSPQDRSKARRQLAADLLAVIDEASRIRENERPLQQPPVSARPPSTSLPDGTLEKIIGADRLMSLAWVRKGLQAARAVCRVETPSGVGTGFLIEGRLLLTNHHVIPDPGVAERSVIAFNYEDDDRGNLLTVHRYNLDRARFRTSEGLDCTAVGVGAGIAEAGDLAEWGALKLTLRRPSVGEFVTIIQHPGGGLKKIALSENQVVNVQEEIAQYTTDTLPGSSGSPVLDDRWEVVAIHHAGGHLSKRDGTGARHFINEGILSAAVDRAVLI